MIRSIHFAFDVPDCDAAIATLYYEGDQDSLESARLTGRVAPRPSDSARPVVILMPGINVAPDTYRWLLVRLAARGYVAVGYAAIGSLGPAGRGITPGLDMAALAPDTIGTRCSASAMAGLLEGTRQAAADIELECDVDRVAVGGHSAGGTVALHNSTPRWIPGLRCVFSYAAHTMTSTSLGHGEATVVAVPAEVPILLLAGAEDGVIAASRDRYRSDDVGHHPVELTFDQGIIRDNNDSWLVELAGGSHFSICDPVDHTSGRSFLENQRPAGNSQAGNKSVSNTLSNILGAFLDNHLPSGSGSDEPVLEAVATAGEAISRWRRR